jgi:hypothetical protein
VSLSKGGQHLGEEQLVALIRESLSVAHKTGALARKDLEQVVVDTTVQPKAIAHPTDARLMHRTPRKLIVRAKDVDRAAAHRARGLVDLFRPVRHAAPLRHVDQPCRSTRHRRPASSR